MSDRRPIALIALGSNLGDRSAHLESAFASLGALPGSLLLARSSIIETEPIGPPGQRPFLNAAAAIESGLGPRELLDAMLAIEVRAGRTRSAAMRWGPRSLDLDLLLFDGSIIAEPGLVVPHPRMHERMFVLRPLAEIAPEAVHPVLGVNVQTLLDCLLARS